MARQSQIRWQRGDYVKLGLAVSDFNKKIQRLEQEQGNLGLPELIDYKSLKKDIVTRKELNRQLKLLRSFKEEGMEELVQLHDETVTVWEQKFILKEQPKIIENIETEISQIKEKPFGMGSEKYKTLKARLDAIKNFDRSLIRKYARTDFKMKKAIQYRENVIEQFDDLPAEFDKIKKHLLKIKNPLNFFDEMQKSKLLQNYFDWYKSPSSFGSFSSDEEIAFAIGYDLGINKKIISGYKTKKQGFYKLKMKK